MRKILILALFGLIGSSAIRCPRMGLQVDNSANPNTHIKGDFMTNPFSPTRK